ncbi:hypothetical protein [Ferruginibacter sp.]
MEKRKKQIDFSVRNIIKQIILFACAGFILFGLGTMAYFLLRALISTFS